MIPGSIPWRPGLHWIWWPSFGLLALYVAARMGAFTLSAVVATPAGFIRLPVTYASVDHPFHVARAETLWRELADGNHLRWIGQHQGGYPVEFYPLGGAWLEVAIRALSIGRLTAEGAHTLTIIALFLLSGVAFAALAREDRLSPAVGLIALTLHVSLPGGWYDGGYTELVQWGLVTNVGGAVAAFLMLPPIVRFLRTGEGWPGIAAVALAAFAIYCNPRSLLGLVALGSAAWLTQVLKDRTVSLAVASLRLAQIAILAALLAAPELVALARFSDLYTFVRYSGYDDLRGYASTAVSAVTWPVIVLGTVGLGTGLFDRKRLATSAAAAALILYVVLTSALVAVPAAAALAPQLELTRLMPLQRLLTIYLAAVASWSMLTWILARIVPTQRWIASVLVTGMAAAVLLIQTRPLEGLPPDPASPAIPSASLYAVTLSGRPEQADLMTSVQAANEAAAPGTTLLVLGSALSWHQQLWAPLWTERPLLYDNWLWYWRPDHVGTPRYAFLTGHHYPDPERTLEHDYLARHGVGAVVVTGAARVAAANSPLLHPLREGVYDAYVVVNPVTMVTFGNRNATSINLDNQRIEAASEEPDPHVTARANWHPRWEATTDATRAEVERLNDGYMRFASNAPAAQAEVVYSVERLDWAARVLAAVGVAGLGWLMVRQRAANSTARRWYSRWLGAAGQPTR